MDVLSKVGAFLNGKKTNIVCGCLVLCITLQALGIAIPILAWGLLLVAAVAGLRSAIEKLKG